MDAQKLYAIQDPVSGYVKIGYSSDPKRRLRQLELTEGRQNLALLLVKEAGNHLEVERKLHMHFRNHRVKGEWFCLTPEQVDQIEALFEKACEAVRVGSTATGCIRWRLSEFLQHNNVTAYKLAHTVKNARANTIYRIAREGNEMKRVDFEVLADMLMGLRELTGKDVQLTDLLEFDPTDEAI